MPDLADIYTDAGMTLMTAQRYEQAEAAFRAALDEDGGRLRARWGLAHALLGQGRYAEGWPHLRSRFELFPKEIKAPANGFPEWLGEPLDGATLLVMPEQGFGDQIMLARFLPALRERGAKLLLATRPALARLLAPLADEVVEMDAGRVALVPRYDRWTHLFTLPERLGITLETLPAEPYLRAPAPRAEAASYRGRIGLFWRTNSARRSLPEPLARRLLSRGWVSLQPEDTGAADFAETAAIVEALDLVVTIDSAVAHLAGALGKPTWVMLPGGRLDWRWMREGEDSPWYPSARLFRQAPGEGWEALAARVEAGLPQA